MPMCGVNFEVGILGGVLDVLGAGVGLGFGRGFGREFGRARRAGGRSQEVNFVLV